jgi:hypothetical protein
MNKRGKVLIRTDNLKPNDFQILAAKWPREAIIKHANIFGCVLIPVEKPVEKPDMSSKKESKKELRKEIARLESENEQLRNEDGHWSWVRHHMDEFMANKPGQHWDSSIPSNTSGPRLTTPYTISYITDQGLIMNLLVIKDYRDDE